MSANPNIIDLSLLARQYVALGWALVPINSGTKAPKGDEWNLRENCVTTAEDCRKIKANVGLAHAYSGTCVLDFDDMEKAGPWLAEHGISMQALFDDPEAVQISSGRKQRGKLLYKLPPGVPPLRTKMIDAAGLEFRCASAGGKTVQDVLPPSIHPDTGQPYLWVFDDLLGDWSRPPVLPAEVLALWYKIAAPEKKTRDEKQPVGLTRDMIRKLVYQHDPNCSYPEWVGIGFAVHHETHGGYMGCEIWDEWSSGGDNYPGTDAVERKWETFGRDYYGPEKTMRSLMDDLGVASAEDFDVLDEPEQVQAVRRAKFAVCGAGEFADGPPQSWIIKGVLPRAQVGMIFGESTAGKSFMVIDMLGAIARGVDWRGMRTKPGRVVLVVAEGVGGAKGRLRAYGQHHGVDISTIPFGIIKDTPDLSKNDHKGLAKQIKEWGGADVIVLDTLAQSSAGANENSGEDMGRVLKHCRELHDETGAMVLLVHHAGKDATRGARGWSGLKAAMDVELEVVRNLGQRSLKISKAKDGQDGIEMGFKLNVVEIGIDEDGDPITSCVIEHTSAPVVSGDSKDGLKNVDRVVLKTLVDAIATGLVDDMHFDELRRAATPHLEMRGKVDNRMRDAGNAIEKLEKLGYFAKDDRSRYSVVDRSNL
jgi:hypothetical protein